MIWLVALQPMTNRDTAMTNAPAASGGSTWTRMVIIDQLTEGDHMKP